MASDALFMALANAKSQPSKTLRAVQSAGQAGEGILGGYLQGKAIRAGQTEAALKPFEIYANLVRAGVPEANVRGIFQQRGIPIPDMGNSGPPKSLADMLKQFDADPNSFPPQQRTLLASLRNQTIINSEKTFVGTDKDGKPLFSDKFGKLSYGDSAGINGPVLPKNSTMPTSTTRSSSEFAKALLPHVKQMRDLVLRADAKGYIGPGAGRAYGNFLAGKVGSTGDPQADQLLGELRTTDSLIKSGMLRTHFGARGGQQMYENFSNMLNSGKQSAPMINGSLNAMESFLKGYASAGDVGANQENPNPQPDSADPAGLF